MPLIRFGKTGSKLFANLEAGRKSREREGGGEREREALAHESLDWYQTSKQKNSKIHAHTYTSIYISEKNHCLCYLCILSNGEEIKYHKFISVVDVELSDRCLITGSEDRLVNLLFWLGFFGSGIIQ